MKVFNSIISFGSLAVCIFLISACTPLQPSAIGIVLAVLSLLVMLLIGWQIAQYIFAERRIREVAERVAQRKLRQLQQETKSHTDKLLRVSNELVQIVPHLCDARLYTHLERPALAVDAYFDSLRSMPQSLPSDRFARLTDNVLKNIVSLLEQPDKDHVGSILAGTRQSYLSLLEHIHSDYKSQVASLLRQSSEVEDDGRLFAVDEEVLSLF